VNGEYDEEYDELDVAFDGAYAADWAIRNARFPATHRIFDQCLLAPVHNRIVGVASARDELDHITRHEFTTYRYAFPLLKQRGLDQQFAGFWRTIEAAFHEINGFKLRPIGVG
jgi:hypothetical protein